MYSSGARDPRLIERRDVATDDPPDRLARGGQPRLAQRSQRRGRGLEQQTVVIYAADHFALTVEHILPHHRPGADRVQRLKLLEYEVQVFFR